MQNRDELGHDRSQKRLVARGGKNLFFRKAEVINIVFGPNIDP
jgi:hypothetical protein